MNKYLIIFILGVMTLSCNNESTPKKDSTNEKSNDATELFFGEKINAEGAQPVDSLRSMMGNNKELTTKLEGTVVEVCQKKGCWMELKKNDGTTMRVTFKDYGFFMPKDCAGKTAIIDGIAKVEETSVADLKEYAKDNGKSKAEIEAITTPETELVFEAKGVILK